VNSASNASSSAVKDEAFLGAPVLAGEVGLLAAAGFTLAGATGSSSNFSQSSSSLAVLVTPGAKNASSQ
jgi:hypothetical protein